MNQCRTGRELLVAESNKLLPSFSYSSPLEVATSSLEEFLKQSHEASLFDLRCSAWLSDGADKISKSWRNSVTDISECSRKRSRHESDVIGKLQLSDFLSESICNNESNDSVLDSNAIATIDTSSLSSSTSVEGFTPASTSSPSSSYTSTSPSSPHLPKNRQDVLMPLFEQNAIQYHPSSCAGVSRSDHTAHLKLEVIRIGALGRQRCIGEGSLDGLSSCSRAPSGRVVPRHCHESQRLCNPTLRKYTTDISLPYSQTKTEESLRTSLQEPRSDITAGSSRASPLSQVGFRQQQRFQESVRYKPQRRQHEMKLQPSICENHTVTQQPQRHATTSPAASLDKNKKSTVVIDIQESSKSDPSPCKSTSSESQRSRQNGKQIPSLIAGMVHRWVRGGSRQKDSDRKVSLGSSSVSTAPSPNVWNVVDIAPDNRACRDVCCTSHTDPSWPPASTREGVCRALNIPDPHNSRESRDVSVDMPQSPINCESEILSLRRQYVNHSGRVEMFQPRLGQRRSDETSNRDETVQKDIRLPYGLDSGDEIKRIYDRNRSSIQRNYMTGMKPQADQGPSCFVKQCDHDGVYHEIWVCQTRGDFIPFLKSSDFETHLARNFLQSIDVASTERLAESVTYKTLRMLRSCRYSTSDILQCVALAVCHLQNVRKKVVVSDPREAAYIGALQVNVSGCKLSYPLFFADFSSSFLVDG